MSTASKATVALISGANQGLGRAVATRLAKEHGYHVIIGSRKLASGETVAAELKEAGHAASAVQLDITSDESIAAAASTIESQFGRLDVLVNNAGILLDSGNPFADPPLPKLPTRELFERTFQTNVFGTACLTDALLPLLRKSATPASPPRVVFVTSIMGTFAAASDRSTLYYNIDYRAYDASKAAFNMLALNYDRELADVGGLVNIACPGLVKTAFLNYSDYGDAPELAATRVVELATLGPDGPRGTLSNRQGPLGW